MNLSLGIVGLPNVGKSTLFNTLTKNKVPAENYPFCTIDPNVGVVPVPDDRLAVLAKIVKTEKLVPAVVEFFDIAGLVRGAHKGEGLGNEFLGHIRNTDALVHVVRSFESTKILHVENKIDPLADKTTIETELILKDLDTIKKKIYTLKSEAKGDPDKQKMYQLSLDLEKTLNEGNLAITFAKTTDPELRSFRKQLGLLTDKPVIYVINGDWEKVDVDLIARLREQVQIPPEFGVLPLNIKMESELGELEPEEQKEFKSELGIEYSGTELLIRECYSLLNLISFFTAGEMEARAWTVEEGSTAPEAAGAIHSDFQTKFIAADVVGYDDFVASEGWLGSKNKGKARLEGKEYIVKDGDVMLFRHGA